MVPIAWHPDSEPLAASGLAVFVEWLRATTRMPDATPELALAWATAPTPDFAAAMAAFMAWPSPRSPNLAHRPGHPAIIRIQGGLRTTWRYDRLPAWATRSLAAADPSALAIFHILRNNTQPDDRLLWMGRPDHPLPLGALYIGATVILADEPTPALAAAEGAMELHEAASGMAR